MSQKVQDKDALSTQKGQAESLQPQMDKVGVASLPLPPYDPSVPIGEFPQSSELVLLVRLVQQP